MTLRLSSWLCLATAAFALFATPLPSVAQDEEAAPETEESQTVAEVIDNAVEPVAYWWDYIVFYTIPIAGQDVPIVLLLLAGTAVFLTVWFGFINLRGFGVAFRTVKGKYSSPDDPGQITHFQALTAALSATVGLGNIAGVAIAIGIGGPGATFWMIVMGFCGMSTKFAECTLGVKYRKIDANGRVRGGAMYYLRDGLKERGLGGLGLVLAIFFAIFVIGGAFGAGNMYQANQATDLVLATFTDAAPGSDEMGNQKTIAGIIMAVLVGAVIIGGIVSIARVTAFLVPLMCGAYVLAALVIIFSNVSEIGPAFGVIFTSAFSTTAVAGGLVGVLIQGVKRAAFSNEAGLGSAPIAHSAVKTNKPASEGYVALLEPFVDTVVVCTMTALVIVITGTWKVSGETVEEIALSATAGGAATEVVVPEAQYVHIRNEAEVGEGDDAVGWLEVIATVDRDTLEETTVTGWISSENYVSHRGVKVTSMAFGSAISWFPYLLAIAVSLFAFSTMISWSYYGEQGVLYLSKKLGPGGQQGCVVAYKILFCLLIVVGASASLGNVLLLSDAMVFSMVVPNLIGLYFLLPVVRRETNDYLQYTREIDGK